MKSTQGQKAPRDGSGSSDSGGPNWVVGADDKGAGTKQEQPPATSGAKLKKPGGWADLSDYSGVSVAAVSVQNAYEQLRLSEGEAKIIRLFTPHFKKLLAHYVPDEIGGYVSCNGSDHDELATHDHCVFCATGFARVELAVLPVIDMQAKSLAYIRCPINTKPASLFGQLANCMTTMGDGLVCVMVTRKSRTQYEVKPIQTSSSADLCDHLVEEFNQNEDRYLAHPYVDQCANRLAAEVVQLVKQSLSLIKLTEQQRQTLKID